MAKEASKVDEEVVKYIKKQEFTTMDDEALVIKSVNLLDENRKKIYGALISDINDNNNKYVLSLVCSLEKSDDDNNEKEKKENSENLYEKIVTIQIKDKEIKHKLIELEDKISMDDLSPSELIEYSFDDNKNAIFYLAQMSKNSCLYYKKGKYKMWKDLIMNPDCEAAFKRLLKIGLINRLFDHVAFPSPKKEENDWIVVNKKTGKKTHIPRVIKQIRIWNISKNTYDYIDTILDGAPNDKDAKKEWEKMLNKFKEEQGIEYINGLLKDNNNKNKDESKQKDQ